MVCGSIKTPIWDKAKQLTDRVSKRFPPQVNELYGKPYRRLREHFAKIGMAGITPDAAARAIAGALTARRAHNTYFVGPDAQLNKIMDRILFGRLRGWLVLRLINP